MIRSRLEDLQQAISALEAVLDARAWKNIGGCRKDWALQL